LATKGSQQKKKVRRSISKAVVNIRATFNNTLVNFTDENGEVLCWDSAGTIGYKGSRKSTPFAAQRAGFRASEKARKMGIREVEIRVNGPGAGRESAIRSIAEAGLAVRAIEDVTPLPHNGCRPKKRRRV